MELGVFRSCSGLTSVAIPISVTSIEDEAFAFCSGLTSLTIPNNVTSIGGYAFGYCSGLTKIIIGNGVKEIESWGFAYCTELEDVHCYAEDVPSTKNNPFEGSNIGNAKLYVPTESVNAYKTTAPWSWFGTIKTLDGEDADLKCKTPTISYSKGELTFNCETEGVEYKTSITDTDIKDYTGSSIQLSVTYTVKVYAEKSGYQNSDVATATLCWIDVDPKTEGITTGSSQIPSKAVLIQNDGGVLTVQGADDGTKIGVYNINGTLAGEGTSRNGCATVNTNLQPGSVAIIKIGDRSVKVMVK